MASFKKFAIIVAGGSGSRMRVGSPKQFLLLKGKPILMHTIEAFHKADSQTEIIIVLPNEHLRSWDFLCKEHHFNIPHQTVIGGESRFQSVRNGISSIDSIEGLAAIHDGVRPFVTPEIINECYKSALRKGSGVTAVPLKDSIREKTKDGYKSRARSNYMIIQTPQTFSLNILKPSFEQKEIDLFTDDANVVENAGHKIELVSGDYNNIKITSPEDLIVAERMMES